MRFWKCCWLLTRITVIAAGLAFMLLILLAFTRLPGRAFAWFAADTYELNAPPDAIVVLGGGGIPSESGLMRSYQAMLVAKAHPDARVILSLPADQPDLEGESNIDKMMQELILHGIARERLTLEKDSYNTHQQALSLYHHLTAEGDHPDLLLVTSGYHLKRALGTFRKAGFERIAGMPAREQAVQTDFGPLVRLRYEFWNNLQYYTVMARELTAMAVYKLKGWM